MTPPTPPSPFPTPCVQLYVHARMQGKWTRLVRPTIQFFLVAFALYVGYTRVSDYKHHWSDVLIGLLQGALIAVLTVSSTRLILCFKFRILQKRKVSITAKTDASLE